MRSRVIIYLLIPILIFIGILITPASEESQKVATMTAVNIQEMIPYEREYTAQQVLLEKTNDGREAKIEEWRLERGARTTYSYVLRLQGFETVIQVDAGAANTRSDGYYAMQAHSPVFEADEPLSIGYPIILFATEQRLVLNQMEVRVLYEEDGVIEKWRILESEES
ncbi:hypothetical protein [Exiguobacterium alkaliphilum]|uniref:Uncharacterized protein n=1 Tax=Exiguobacterium alkaliphilum TaxID=1428684 RepID=A0ABT2KWB8_9BACL|nr:hypothetical protein [Exiguobacterium alkaliphilum]MCT4795217.1 hypothetical protein [Exiguobacterium alkaliphilum]QUE85511.1 hypothetical protein KB235_10080 [Exiguobacterium alkaliphilum]